MPYPDYARSERIADGTMHVLGVSGALVGAAFLMIAADVSDGPGQRLALSVYGAALVLTFVASACYHMIPSDALRPILRRIDHAAIYVKIAGTYTPLVVLIGSGLAYAVLGVVWALAAFGVVRKLFFWRLPGRFDPLLYLGMGWLSVLLLWSLVPLVPWATTALIVAGGLLYTAGVLFYQWESLKYANAIWHGFVLVASACYFLAIAVGLQSGAPGV
ncbi:PAQR family membrane homeostasis protein TrhA [Thalassococcus sp. BH17M4-6]|uniref:PAQR family membrane homeostasis protein TrhA n=1 Tax=Thalassococcus sp. BH17M4-6 TaxID=3413148 RepID=UPI003BBAA2E1